MTRSQNVWANSASSIAAALREIRQASHRTKSESIQKHWLKLDLIRLTLHHRKSPVGDGFASHATPVTSHHVNLTPMLQLERPISYPTTGFKRPTADGSAWARSLAEQLVSAGAILAVPGSPRTQDLVGDLRWEKPNAFCWFVAFGDKAGDAKRLDFDETHCVENLGIYFLRAGQVVGYLSTIEAAGVDDPEDYRMAWLFWQQVAPLRRAFIDDSYAHLWSE